MRTKYVLPRSLTAPLAFEDKRHTSSPPIARPFSGYRNPRDMDFFWEKEITMNDKNYGTLTIEQDTSHKPFRAFDNPAHTNDAIKLAKQDIGHAVGAYPCNRGAVVVEQGNVVMELKAGNARIKICDDHCRDKTPEEVKAILTRISNKALTELTAQAREGQS